MSEAQARRTSDDKRPLTPSDSSGGRADGEREGERGSSGKGQEKEPGRTESSRDKFGLFDILWLLLLPFLPDAREHAVD